MAIKDCMHRCITSPLLDIGNGGRNLTRSFHVQKLDVILLNDNCAFLVYITAHPDRFAASLM